MKRSEKKQGVISRGISNAGSVRNMGDENLFVYIKKYLPIAAALLLFLMSAGFIFIKLISAKRDNDRWGDYDECGIF